jgi:hypothetical protein
MVGRMRHDGMAHVAVLVGAMWCTLAWVLVPYVVLTALTGYTRPYVAVERCFVSSGWVSGCVSL